MSAGAPDGPGALYEAVIAGDAAKVRKLAPSADVNERNEDNGWTPLSVAAANGDAEIVAALLAQPGVDVGARGDDERTALHIAAERGHDDVVTLLLAHPGADPNAKQAPGRTPLSLAAFAGADKVAARLLADTRTDPNLVDRDRQTALHWAALGGHLDVVETLLADARVNVGVRNRPGGMTAEQVALGVGQDAIAAAITARARTAPGDDELSPGDSPGDEVDESPPFSPHPHVPEPPGLRDPHPGR
jgi:ankyrin repeat protein